MGIKDFFKKVWSGVKNVGGKIWNGLKKGIGFVGKIAKPIINIAKPILNGMSMIPGKLGIIGTVGSVASEAAKGLIDQIPNQDAKDKLNQLVDRGKDLLDTGQQKAQEIASKVQPYAQAGLNIIDKVPLLANTVNNRLNPSQRSIALSQMNPPHMM